MTAPGQFLDRLALWWLTDRYVLIPPNTDRAVIDGYCVARSDTHRTIGRHDIQVPPGWHVKAPERPPALATFVPSIGHAEPRTVVRADEGLVTYQTPDGVPHVMTVDGFNRWLRDKRAVQMPELWDGIEARLVEVRVREEPSKPGQTARAAVQE